MAKPKYRLTSAHFLEGAIYAEAGKIVGSVEEGADFNWDGPPDFAMEPLNDEARAAIVATHAGTIPVDPIAEMARNVNPSPQEQAADATFAASKQAEVASTEVAPAEAEPAPAEPAADEEAPQEEPAPAKKGRG